MVDRTLNSHIEEALRLRLEIEALKAKLEGHEKRIKDELTERDINTYVHKNMTVRYKEIESKRFDSKTFKTDYPDLAQQYTKTSTTKRFTIVS